MTTVLTPKKLVKYLDKFYGEEYKITEETAKKVLEECEREYDSEFSEDELIEMVEKYLNEIEEADQKAIHENLMSVIENYLIEM